jgi:hypothetical protein
LFWFSPNFTSRNFSLRFWFDSNFLKQFFFFYQN